MKTDMGEDRKYPDAEAFRNDAGDMRDCASVEVSWVARDSQGRDLFASDMTITGHQAAAMFEGIAATCEPVRTVEQIAEEAASNMFAELGINGKEHYDRALTEFYWTLGDAVQYEEGVLAFTRNVIAVVKSEGVI